MKQNTTKVLDELFKGFAPTGQSFSKAIFKKHLESVRKVFGISEEVLFERTKKRQSTEARQTLYLLCRRSNLKIVEVQEFLEDYNFTEHHSTIVRGIESANKRLKKEKLYRNIVKIITI